MHPDIDYILPDESGVYTVPKSDWDTIKEIKSMWAEKVSQYRA